MISHTDYHTYQEIMDELLRPIVAEGVDVETLKGLYESKRVYLEKLRVQCFREINSGRPTDFAEKDLKLIVKALAKTEIDIKNLVIDELKSTLKNYN